MVLNTNSVFTSPRLVGSMHHSWPGPSSCSGSSPAATYTSPSWMTGVASLVARRAEVRLGFLGVGVELPEQSGLPSLPCGAEAVQPAVAAAKEDLRHVA